MHLCALISSRDKLALSTMACINIPVFGQCVREAENILALSVPDCIAVALFHRGQSCSSQTLKASIQSEKN